MPPEYVGNPLSGLDISAGSPQRHRQPFCTAWPLLDAVLYHLFDQLVYGWLNRPPRRNDVSVHLRLKIESVSLQLFADDDVGRTVCGLGCHSRPPYNCFFQRASAALFAIILRFLGDNDSALARPPFGGPQFRQGDGGRVLLSLRA